MKFITPEYLSSFEKDYWAGKYPSQRFGQALVNSLVRETQSYWVTFQQDNPEIENEIYYSNDIYWVKKLLWENVIQCEVPEVHSQED